MFAQIFKSSVYKMFGQNNCKMRIFECKSVSLKNRHQKTKLNFSNKAKKGRSCSIMVRVNCVPSLEFHKCNEHKTKLGMSNVHGTECHFKYYADI